MAQDPDLAQPIVAPIASAEAGKVDRQDADSYANDNYDTLDPNAVDRGYWIACLEDAERVERDWRQRGREIIEIYRNAGRSLGTSKKARGSIVFNVLYANTEVLLPAIFAKQPEPVVRSRFVKVQDPLEAMSMLQGMMAMAPPGMPGMMQPPPPSMPGGPGAAPTSPVAPPAPGGPPIAASAPSPPSGPGAPPFPPNMPPPPSSPEMMAGGIGAAGPGTPPPGQPPAPGVPPLGMVPGMPQPAPNRPKQSDIETAAAVVEKALEIVLDDEQSHEAVKQAIKDVLLPGRGVARCRWTPHMVSQPVAGLTQQPNQAAPPSVERKIWEEVGDEYVYWEDLLLDPVRSAADTNWIAFRHLFTRQALETEFQGSPQYDMLKAAGRLGELFKWTDESAAKSPVGGGSAMKSAAKLGDHVKKAMAWEIWDRVSRTIIWFIKEAGGVVMRVDPDSYKLSGFYPIPVPMLAVSTSDTRIPVPYYDIYTNLASDLDDTSQAISRLTKKIKVRGAYNAASPKIADILVADDAKMVPVEGVDLLSGGLSNHIWIVPILEWVNALKELYLDRDQIKQSIYEIMGISDIMRGATKASETATAQRIKGSMGVNRIEDPRQTANNFVRDLMRLKAEVICKNFDAATLEAMTGEKITPEVEAILRSDFQRMCSIDIEADSTIQVDEQAEQQSMAAIMTAVQAVMAGAAAMLQTGILPPPQVIMLSLEMLKMFLHPVRFSRPVIEMIDDFQEQLQQQMMLQAVMPPPPPPMATPGPGGGPPAPGGPGGGNGTIPQGMPSLPPGGGPPGMPPPPMM